MKSYYLINKETDLLGSYDLSEMQMYPHILSWLLRMGKKPGVTPAEDWGKVKSLMARVKNHISFHTYGVKPSEITVDFFSPEVRKLFLAVFGNGSETYTKDWLDAFEAVKDAIDRQVGNDRSMCQYGAANGKRCDKCQCPDPLSEQEYPTEKAKAWLSMFDKSDTAHGVDDGEIWDKARQRDAERSAALKKEIAAKIAAETSAKLAGDTEKPRFVVEQVPEMYYFATLQGGDAMCGQAPMRFRILDSEANDIAILYTASQKTANEVAALLNESQSDDVGMGNKALVKYLAAKVKQPNVLFWNEPDRETGYGSLLDAMEDAGTGVPMSEDGEQYVCNDCGARFDDNYDAAKHWVTTHMTAEWFIERFSMGVRLNQQEIELLIKAGSFNT